MFIAVLVQCRPRGVHDSTSTFGSPRGRGGQSRFHKSGVRRFLGATPNADMCAISDSGTLRTSTAPAVLCCQSFMGLAICMRLVFASNLHGIQNYRAHSRLKPRQKTCPIGSSPPVTPPQEAPCMMLQPRLLLWNGVVGMLECSAVLLGTASARN